MNPHAQLTCPICQGIEFQPILSGCDYKTYIDEIEYQLVRCQACSFVMQNNPPGPREMARYYPSDYYSYNSSGDLLSKLKHKARSLTKPFPFLYQKILFQDCLLECPDETSSLLDAGCGDGAALRTLRGLGWQKLYGTEINPQVVESLKAQGFQAKTATNLASAGFDSKQFDVVRMYHVLEHVYDPRKELNAVRRILTPGGQLLIGVPNFDSVQRKIFGRYFFALQLPTHISHFNPQTIRRLLETEGFRVIRLQTGGWFGLAQSLAIWLRVRFQIRLPGLVVTALTFLLLPLSLIILIFQSGPVINIQAVKQ